MSLEAYKNRNYQKEYRKRNKKKLRLWMANYYKKNQNLLRALAKTYYHEHQKEKQEYSSNFRKKHPKIIKKRYLKRQYNLSTQAVLLLKKKQKYQCAICEKKRKLYIDHSHKNNKVRGLLCHKCNVGLGQFKESIKSFQNAIKYIRKWKELLQGL